MTRIGYAGQHNHTPTEAAQRWAKEHFTAPRSLTRIELAGTLAIDFQLIDGTAAYRCCWDDSRGTYAIFRF